MRLFLLDSWAYTVLPYKCPNGYYMYKTCPGRIVRNKFSRTTQILRYFKKMLPRKLITKHCIHIFCIQFSVALETVNSHLMFKLLSKSKYPNEMIYFLTEYTLIIHLQFIIGSKRKISYFVNISFENVSEHFVSDNIFKRLKFDYSSLETVSNQQIKLRAIFLVIAYSWKSD